MIIDFRNDTKANISEDIIIDLNRSVELTLADEGILLPCELSITLVNNEEIRLLNKKYRKLDKPTDVLSFPTNALNEEGETPVFLGDIIISLEKAESQAEEYGHSLLRELAFLTVHSTLHLLGYDHQSEEESQTMFKKQEDILNSAGIER